MHPKLPIVAALIVTAFSLMGLAGKPPLVAAGLQSSTSGGSQFAPNNRYSGNTCYEFKSKNTYAMSGSSATWANYHVVQYNWKTAVIPPPGTYHLVINGTGYDVQTTLESAGYQIGIVNPYGIGDAGVSQTNYGYGQIVTGGDSLGGGHLYFSAGVYVYVNPGTVVPLHIWSTGTLSGASPVVSSVLRETLSYIDPVSGNKVYFSDTTYDVVTLSYSKNLSTGGSIDSRKMFGQPLVDGHVPGDANGDLRPVVFNPWRAYGGMFIGNIAYLNNDQSGTGRIQLWTLFGSTGTNLAGCVSLFDKGVPNRPNVTGAFTVDLFSPKSDDPNYGVQASQA